MSGYQARSFTLAEAPARPASAKDSPPLSANPPRPYLASHLEGPSGRPATHPAPATSLAEIRFPILNEDLTPLTQILNTLGLVAGYSDDTASFGLTIPLI